MTTTRREYFIKSERLQQVWALTKDRRAAICEVWSHEFGHELRLMVSGDDLPRTQVCRSSEELVTVQDSWRRALEARGWTKVGG